ncbi:1800_t:CDS:2, partial [Funneliformis mosseae]
IEKLLIKKKVKIVIKNKWKKLQHGLIYQNNQDIVLDINTIGDNFKYKDSLIKSANENNNTLDKLKNYYYLTKSECIVGQNNQTLIHLDSINNNNAILQATKAVNDYYFHTLDNPSHRSDSFWNDMVEHFEAYRTYNQFSYINTEMSSNHNQNHLKCINKLIIVLEPLSNCINQFVKENYNNLYIKLSNFSWGLFAPRSFGIFPMIAINFNTISDFHWNEKDEENCFCILIALGDYEGAPQNLPIKKFTKLKSFQTKMELFNDQRRFNI